MPIQRLPTTCRAGSFRRSSWSPSGRLLRLVHGQLEPQFAHALVVAVAVLITVSPLCVSIGDTDVDYGRRRPWCSRRPTGTRRGADGFEKVDTLVVDKTVVADRKGRA